MIGRILKRWRARAPKRRELFVHEDDWGEIEVLPAASAPWCAAEIRRIEALSSARRDPDGYGWTDLHVRPSPPHTLAELRVPFPDAVRALASALPPFDVVTSGTFSAPQPVPRVRAFGPAQNVGIVLVPDRTGDIVEMISLVLNGSAETCNAVQRAASALPAPAPLVAVDWQQGTIAPL